jgi:hypothetical protein
MSDFATKPNRGIKSFHCTEFFSAAILNKGDVAEFIGCGDVVNETISPIPVDNVTVGECHQRRCCFYTGANKDGNEYCMYADTSVPEELSQSQSPPFLVGECTQGWKATLYHKGGIKKTEVDCGVTLDLPTPADTFDRIVLARCPSPVRAEEEFVVDTFGADEDNFADLALDDNTENFADVQNNELDSFQTDQAISDVAFDQTFELEGDDFADQAFASFNTEEDFADQAIYENFDIEDESSHHGFEDQASQESESSF